MKQMPWLAFTIDRGSRIPVFEQICDGIRMRAVKGDLAAGSLLPPTRVFATELGVSRSTVVTAYEQLVAEGYLQSQPGSGYRLCPVGEVELPSEAMTLQSVAPEEKSRQVACFEAGQPDMRLFPYRQWAKTIARICRRNPQQLLEGGRVFGNFELRQAIAAHVSEWRGIEADPNQIIVTAGATDALEICLRFLAKPGEGIGVEDPGYLPLLRFVRAQGLKPIYLRVDEQGATLPVKDKPPKLVALTPSHQFPLGGAMSPERRQEFLRWALQENAWILEDDYDSEFRYAGRPIPALAGFDRLNRTIYIGSLSKIFSNALRLGYAIVPQELLEGFQGSMRASGLKASIMPQQPLAEFITSGEFYRHLRRVRRIYGERRKYLLSRLAEDFADFGVVRDTQAGMQLVFHLKEAFDDRSLTRLATDRGLRLQALSEHAEEAPGCNGLILGFCAFSEEEMEPALAVLKSCLEENRDQVTNSARS
ncbi:transcriptional regulator, GntR family protein [Roseobacter sp. SK209-2-6]|uniref:MocR-like pyridoxine biosynthesis transcription factor PdxR n=1 Tax=Roseobacter sp. SK209-2-6 TaxID=388739 RepID=UPI0000F3C19C|nr:PLP-dependent aminotransferase family protein [Roseobacter sp. SK209-2-6]EBA15330.1 transcriptional regulator, GntR family protein [Roseobacter sp. SK209-2-6]